MVGEIVYVDKNTFEDLIEFQHVEFDVVQGVLFWRRKELQDTRYNKLINKLYNKRTDMRHEKSQQR